MTQESPETFEFSIRTEYQPEEEQWRVYDEKEQVEATRERRHDAIAAVAAKIEIKRKERFQT